MAVRKPLVMGSDGRPQQLQSGDSIGAVETGQFSVTADAALTAGNPVYASAAGHANKARANASGTKEVIGLCMADISNAASGQVQCNGVLTLTTAQWDAIAGTTGGLTFNTVYFLSAGTAGLITATPPSTVGQFIVTLGKALSTTDFEIHLETPILL